METRFSPEQLEDHNFRRSEGVLRKCVHCGFCTATCPTYVVLGDELDSPRGRIYLIKDMLENERKPTAKTVQHIDRCLSCLACMTTCPSGVSYRHLIDHAREYVEDHYDRPWKDKFMRWALAKTMPYPKRFAWALRAARLARPFAGLIGKVPALRPAAAALALSARSEHAQPVSPRIQAVNPKQRVAIFEGCVQPTLMPSINSATANLLARFGIEAVTIQGDGCCGSLSHHLGRSAEAIMMVKANLRTWGAAVQGGECGALIITASGCASTIFDYREMLEGDPEAEALLEPLEGKIFELSEFLASLSLPQLEANDIRIAYHSACSLQHGLKVTEAPKALLKGAGFTVLEPAESHLCCGSAGVYNILQSEIADQLLARKMENIDKLEAEAIAAGNIGCLTQIGRASTLPVRHLAEFLDWAYDENRRAREILQKP